jgi:predicted enzyme related to lactoylglutathione lyase
MPTVTRHAPGTFCWPELASPDAKASLAFYTALFGWTVNEFPMESGAYYMLQLDGRDVGAAYDLTPAMREQKVPPHWAAYVAVASADDTAQRVEAAGGRVLQPPFDVMQHGRMAVVADPAGAVFCLWQAIQNNGVGALGEPGTLGWTQLNTRDTMRAKTFYTAVLGWTFRDDPLGPDASYTTWLKSDGPAGGMMPMPAGTPAEAPAHWLSYFTVANVDESHAQAVGLGATSWVAPADVPGGPRFAVLCDPQGATFALMSGM